MIDRKRFQLYTDYLDKFNTMNDADMGQLFRAILQFERGITPEGLSPMAQLAFDCIKGQLASDMEAWEDTAKSKSEAAKKAANARWNDASRIDKDASGCATHADACERIETQCDGMRQDASDAVTVTVTDTVTDKDIKERAPKGAQEKSSRFSAPTAEQVRDYCREKGLLKTDPQQFVDFYASKGWMVGSSRMKDWKAAVRNWERRDDRAAPKAYHDKPPNRFNNFPQRDYDYEELERQLLC